MADTPLVRPRLHKVVVGSEALKALGEMNMVAIDPLIAGGVVLSTAVTDAVYVFFNAAVSDRRRVSAASWSAAWYLLSAFAVISYTSNWVYVLFAALGSWIGGYLSITALDHGAPTRRR
jgi:hypothetical protein